VGEIADVEGSMGIRRQVLGAARDGGGGRRRRGGVTIVRYTAGWLLDRV